MTPHTKWEPLLIVGAWGLSVALHGALLVPFFSFSGGDALESGSGNDMLVTEQGIAIEGFSFSGLDQATVEAVEVPESQASQARPEIKEVKAEEKPTQETQPEDIKAAELPKDTEVLQSPTGPEQEIAKPKEPEVKELETPQPPQTATVEQPEQVAVKEERSAGPKQVGGTATLTSAYFGKLRSHIERHKINPHSQLTGLVVVRFMIGPDGKVLSRHVVQSSGHTVLDDAAIQSLDRAAPFPPFPEGMPREPRMVSIPFRFRTR